MLSVCQIRDRSVLCFYLRVDSLGSALELMDSIEHHVTEISERLDKFIKEPKDVKGYMLINANILKDVKVGKGKTLRGHIYI